MLEISIRDHMNDKQAAIEHVQDDDFRAREKHIDSEHGIHEVWKRQTVEDAYAELFGDSIEEYNKTQKRKDRRIDGVQGYIADVDADKRGAKRTKRINGKKVRDESAETGKRLIYERVISAGNTNTSRTESGRCRYRDVKPSMRQIAHARKAGKTAEVVGDIYHPSQRAGKHEQRDNQLPYAVVYEATKRQVEEFEKRNPQFHLVSADWHADEYYVNKKGVIEYGVPHAHVFVIPFATGYKQGMSVQQSISRALAMQGFKDKVIDGRKVSAYEQWNKSEQASMEAITMEVYNAYCEKHPDYAKAHGEMVIVHPDAEKDVENLDPAKYRELKELEADISEAVETIEDQQSEIEKLQKRIALLEESQSKMMSDFRSDALSEISKATKAKEEYTTVSNKVSETERLLKEKEIEIQKLAKQKEDTETELVEYKSKTKKHIKDEEAKHLRELEETKKQKEKEITETVDNVVQQIQVMTSQAFADCMDGIVEIVESQDMDMASWASNKTLKNGRTLLEQYQADRQGKTANVEAVVDKFKTSKLEELTEKLEEVAQSYKDSQKDATSMTL